MLQTWLALSREGNKIEGKTFIGSSTQSVFKDSPLGSLKKSTSDTRDKQGNEGIKFRPFCL